MTVVSWPPEVNQKFFAYNKQPIENTKEFESVSGRKVGYLINTKAIMKFQCSLEVQRHTEEDNFWNWFNYTLGSTAGAFTCAALGTNTYRFVSIPQPQDTNQTSRVLQMEIEEVF